MADCGLIQKVKENLVNIVNWARVTSILDQGVDS